jgi:hypothetical protein
MALRTIVIKPGEKIIVPYGTRIQSLVNDGSITVTSTCDNLPTPGSYRCGMFYVILDSDANTGHSMDETLTYFVNLKVGSNIYEVNRKFIASGDDPGSPNLAPIYNTHVPDQALFRFTQVLRDTGPDKRQGIYLYFKAVGGVWDTLEMKVDNRGSIQYYKPTDIACNDYPYGA